MKLIIQFLVISCIAFTASTAHAQNRPEFVIRNVVRVFLHQPGYDGKSLGADYSVMTEEDDGFVVTRLNIALPGRKYLRWTVIRKVPSSERMRVEFFCTERNVVSPDEYGAIIYVHGPDDFDGGEWRSGKNGATRHQTEVVR